jgi:hypothetical protein
LSAGVIAKGVKKMFLSLSGALLASQLVVTAAAQVPKIDFMPGCRGATTMGLGATLQNCIEDEQRARDQLVKEWSQFSNPDKTSCTEEISGFEPSYVELLTCLEAARDAKQAPQQ